MSHSDQNSVISSENLKENSGLEEKIEINPSKRSIIEVVLSGSPVPKIT